LEPAEEPGSQGSRLVERLRISIDDLNFVVRLELEKTTLTCNIFKALLPFRNRAIHSRWSGEAVLVPFGDLEFGVGIENHTRHPSRGAMSCFIPAAIAKRNCCSPMAARRLQARWAPWPATIS
jgi:hypothetical protein